MRQSRQPYTALLALSVVGVLIALAPMPYGYYRLLRLWFCGVSIFFASRLTPPWSAPHVWFLGGLALLYNPIVPVVLGDKTLWTIVNVGSVAYYGVLMRRHVVR